MQQRAPETAAALAQDEAKPLSAEEIVKYNTDKKITQPRLDIQALPTYLEKIDALKDKEAEESLPVIINIILHIQATLKAEVLAMKESQVDATKFEKMLENLEKTLLIFGETDRVTQGGEEAQKAYLGKLKAKAAEKSKATGKDVDVFADLALLVEDANTVALTPNTKELWYELAVWMEGLYWHNAHHLKQKDFDNNNEPKKTKSLLKGLWSNKLYYPCVDALDGAIFLLYDITKLDVSINYHRASLIIRKKYEEYAPEAIQAMGATVPVAGAAYNTEILVSKRAGYHKQRVRYRPDSIPDEVSLVTIMDEMFANPMSVALSTKLHLSDDDRIVDFDKLLTRMPVMSNKLKSALSGFLARANIVINDYTNPSKLRFFNPASFLPTSITPDFAQKTHYRIAMTAKAELQAAEKTNDVHKMLQIMLKLYQGAKEGDSQTLLPALKKLILDQIELIMACKDAQDKPIEYHLEVIPKDAEGFETLEIDFPEEHARECKIIIDVVEGYLSNPLGLELATMLGRNVDARLQHFEALIKENKYQFSAQQKLDFATFRQEAFDSMNSYTDPSNYSLLNPVRWFPSLQNLPVASYLANTHVAYVEEVQGKMRLVNGVKEHILHMLQMRLELQGKNSAKLLGEVTNFLVKCMDKMIPAHAYHRFSQQPVHENSVRHVSRIK